MKKLIDLCKKINIDVSREQAECFNKYYEMLVKKNKVMNLTSITDKDDVIVKHFVDSLSIIPVIRGLYNELSENVYDNDNKSSAISFSIIDVGTGAGFPGIPLKIIMPDCELVMLDSVNKKLKFIDEVIDELKLSGVRTVHGRAEDIASDKNYRERFDLCLSRAVANLSVLSEYCIPFVRKGGYFISYKAGVCEDEINDSKPAVNMLGGKINKVHNFTLPDSDNERTLVCIKKINNTAGKYPRKAGIPSKMPLGKA